MWGSHEIGIKSRRVARVTYRCSDCGFRDVVANGELTMPDLPDAERRRRGYRVR